MTTTRTKRPKLPDDLTQARMRLLQTTVRNEREQHHPYAWPPGEVRPFGTDLTMLPALEAGGYIEVRAKVLDEIERRDMDAGIKRAVEDARDVLVSNPDGWHRAVELLGAAGAIESRLRETVWRITDKGRAAVAEYGAAPQPDNLGLTLPGERGPF